MADNYEPVAREFIEIRSKEIGVPEITRWEQQLPSQSHILDLGCGHGLPLASALQAKGHYLYGIDLSPTLIDEYKRNISGSKVECGSALDSSYFDRKFDAVLAIGLFFLMAEEEQRDCFPRIADVLNPGGRFLFTAPVQEARWLDALSGNLSHSLGEKTYRELLLGAGFEIDAEYIDSGKAHYYDSMKRNS